MRYTRIYSDEQGESHFADVEVQLSHQGKLGSLSEKFPVKSVQFRENPAEYDWDFHNAPDKQFVILLDGAIEITTSLGEKRTFRSGDILLVEDTTGKGHKTSNIEKEVRKSLFIQL
ncbi:MAG TPA: hypothetical protein VFD91_17720 [Mariniphaga sp.]|nr:hypothetical protein [Mariniphaga sp.]